MLIHAYGLFWRNDEVLWQPGRGSRPGFQLLGRRGKNISTLQLTDFRSQHGIYVMYNEWGSYYVGLALTGTIGRRLRAHSIRDAHQGKWDRFSWFGFDRVLLSHDPEGLQRLKRMPISQQVDPGKILRDVEALLIHVMPSVNKRNERFASAKEWKQVRLDEREHYLKRVRG